MLSKSEVKKRAYLAKIKYKKNHPIKVKRSGIRYRMANKERLNAAAKKWRTANPEKVKQMVGDWQKRNKKHFLKVVKKWLKNKMSESPWYGMLKSAKARAIKNKQAFDLTQEWAKDRWTGKCELTNIDFMKKESGTGPCMFSASLDRVNNDIGYTKKNCRFILFGLNTMKNTGTDQDMVMIARRLIENTERCAK